MLTGQLVESDRTQRPTDDLPPQDVVFLADLIDDPDERHNLRDRHPDLTAERRAAAESWRGRIEERWEREWRARMPKIGVTGWQAP